MNKKEVSKEAPAEPAKSESNAESNNINLPSLKEKQNKQILWAVILMLSILVIILLTPYVINNFFNKFTYIGLDFQKTRLEKIDFYSARVPTTVTMPVTGALISLDKITGNYPVNFRNDPRKLEYIKVEIPDNKISFLKDNIVYISLNSNDPPCEQNVISAVTLTNFLIDFGSLKVRGAITDKNYSEANNVPYVTCENSPRNTVILLKSGNETIIKKDKDNCYELIYNNCEILPVSEKFILSILENYMSFFEKK